MGKTKETQIEMEDTIYQILSEGDLMGISELRTKTERRWPEGYSVELFNAALNDLIAEGDAVQSGLFYSIKH